MQSQCRRTRSIEVPSELKIITQCRGTDLGSLDWLKREVPTWGPGMSLAQSFYEADSFYERLTLRLVRERIGRCLRERYQISKELPPKLLALIRKLEAIENKSLRGRSLVEKFDAIEGNYLLRHAPPLEPRSVGLSDDWLWCT